MIDLEYARSILSYDPKTGLFTRIKTTKGKAKIGTNAGSKCHGYILIGLRDKKVRAHNLAWLFYYGVEQDGMLDHINHNRSDNRIENLRIASRLENNKNTSLRKDNTSGFCGVYFRNDSKKWQVEISINGKRTKIGAFHKKEDAIEARKKANIVHGYHENHGVKND